MQLFDKITVETSIIDQYTQLCIEIIQEYDEVVGYFTIGEG